MSLPVSQYEALLAQVRGLRRQAQHVQQLADPLLFNGSIEQQDRYGKSQQQYRSDNLVMEPLNRDTLRDRITETEECNLEGATGYTIQNADETSRDATSSSANNDTWPVEQTMWNFGSTNVSIHRQMEIPSAMSFASSSGAPIERLSVTPDISKCSSQQLEAKVEMVYSLLAMLGGQEHADMGETLLALSTNRDSCLAMRHSGCIPLLVQMVQSDKNSETRKKASMALNNLIQSQPDEKIRKRETRILKLLENICAYMEALNENIEFVCDSPSEDGEDRHPVQTIAHLMKLSFDEGHRHAICNLGGIHTIAKLVEAEHAIHGSTLGEPQCILMRRYACMALTNLTFGDSGNKALLCSYKDFMKSLVTQLRSPSDELRQVTASVLRNLSWRADASSKEILREIGSVRALTLAAMLDNKENTLKSILSALWNLSAHCTENKSEICAVEGALECLVNLLSYKSSSKSLAIIENSGGILRNISSQIAVRDDYRLILRERNCLQILLSQLKSPSLTIVSNACGTLWNLSAKNATDQELLWQLGAPTMLRSLNHSKHKMIAMGSSATLKNLLSAKPDAALVPHVDSTARSLDLPVLPTLGVRKQKALLKDLDQNLSETFDNLDRNPNWIKTRNKDPSTPHDETASGCFTSLNANEPSTSFTGDKTTSLPFTVNSGRYDMTIANSSNLSTPNYEKVGNFLVNSAELVQTDNVIDNDRHKMEKRYKEVMDEKDHCSTEDISDNELQQMSNRSNDSLKTNIGNFDSCDGTDDERKKMKEPQQSVEDNTLQREENEKQDFGREKKARIVENQETQRHSDGLNERTAPSTSKLPNRLSKNSAIPKSKLPSRCFVPNSTFKLKNQDVSQNEEIVITNSDVGNVEVSRVISNNGNNTPVCQPQGRNLTREEIIETSQVSKEDCNKRDDISTSQLIEKQSCDAEIGSHGIKKCMVQKTQLNFKRSISDNLNISEENNADQLSITQVLPEVSVGQTSDLFDVTQMDTETQRNPCQESPKEENIPINLEKTDAPTKYVGKTLDMSPEYTTEATANCVVFNEKNSERLERSCNDSANILDTRMLDPEAMIESLDRFTAELVSQASSHLQNRDSMYKSSANNTWDEQTSPNEATFPSISVSAPNVVSFTSENESKHLNKEKEPTNELPSLDTTSTMTDSLLIAMEATKIAAVFKEAADESSSANSLISLELDRIQPPSHLNSLTNSIIGFDDSKPNSPKMLRKKSLPSNVLLVKRTFQHHHQHSLQHTASVDNLPAGASHTHKDSSGNDLRLHEGTLIQPCSSLLNFMTSSNGRLDSLMNADLENMNPPSLFNELENSLADVATSELCNETELFESCLTHVNATTDSVFGCTENDVTEFSDAASVTPIQSDVNSSSCENLAKKSRTTKSLTSKQRRVLAKERYRTYTIAAGMIFKDQQLEEEGISSTTPTGKATPKERRLSERSRFETQVLDVSQLPKNFGSESNVSSESSPQQSPLKSRISVRKNFLQRRLNSKERFMTQTLDDSDLHNRMVEKEANKVVEKLRETKTTHDDLLECETLSLVSNEDDSEDKSADLSNYCTYHKSWNQRENVPVIPAETSDVEDDNLDKTSRKPKIVKPDPLKSQENNKEPDDIVQSKGIRGRRKPLYNKSNVNKITPKSIRPLKNITPNLIQNVSIKPTPPKPKITTKPLAKVEPIPKYRPTIPASPKKSSPSKIRTPKPLERQGTFTKDDEATPQISKLPTKSPSPKVLPKQSNIPRFGLFKSASSDRSPRTPTSVAYNRSTSADGHEHDRKIQNSPSTHSLKAENGKMQQNGAIRKTSQGQKSNSNTSLNNSTKKQVTSKIASIWKKIEESKKKSIPKNDIKKWIEARKEAEDFEDKDDEEDGQKRISRLGSFIVMDENEKIEVQ